MLFRITIVCLFCLFFGLAIGQQNDTIGASNVIKLPVVTVEKLRPVPFVWILGDSVLQQYSNQDLGKVLAIENGIYIKSYGLGGLTTMSKRGASASQTQVLWNGMPINSPNLGQQDLSLLPLLFTDYLMVENSSAPNGGLEGAVHFQNSTAIQKGVTAFYSKQIGSFGINNSAFKAVYGNGKWGGKSAFFISEATNNFSYNDYSLPNKPKVERNNAALSGYGWSQQLYRENKKSNTAIFTQYTHFDRQIPSAIGVTLARPYQMDNSFKAVAKQIWFDRKIVQRFQVGVIKDQLHYTDSSAAIFSKATTTQLSSSYQASFLNSDRKWNGDFRINGLYFVSQSSGFAQNHNQLRGSAQLLASRSINHSYLELKLRQDLVDAKWSPLLPYISFFGQFKKNRNWNYATQLSTNYRTPTLNDLYWNPGGNENLLPEKSVGGEATIRYSANRFSLFKVAYFYSLTDNWIQWLPTNLGYWTPQNVKNVERQGVELAVRKKLFINNFTSLSLSSNYTYVSAINKRVSSASDASLGKQLLYVPHHTVGFTAIFAYKKLECSYQQQVYSKTYIDAINQRYLPYVAPASIQIGTTLQDVNAAATFSLKIENVFNEPFQIIANQPMPGRYFLLNIKISLTNKG